MDRLTVYRKAKLAALIKASPYNGNQNAFADKVRLSKGRISQLLHPENAFGERSARSIATRLRLGDRYFEDGFGEGSPAPVPVEHGWPFPDVDRARFDGLKDRRLESADYKISLDLA